MHRAQDDPTDGRTEVLIETDDTDSDIVSDALSVVERHDARTTELAKVIAHAYERPILAAEAEARRARRAARWAWMTAVMVSVGLSVAVSWIARNDAQLRIQSDTLSDARVALDAAHADLADVRQQAEIERAGLAAAVERERARADDLAEQAAEAAQERERLRAALASSIERSARLAGSDGTHAAMARAE